MHGAAGQYRLNVQESQAALSAYLRSLGRDRLPLSAGQSLEDYVSATVHFHLAETSASLLLSANGSFVLEWSRKGQSRTDVGTWQRCEGGVTLRPLDHRGAGRPLARPLQFHITPRGLAMSSGLERIVLDSVGADEVPTQP